MLRRCNVLVLVLLLFLSARCGARSSAERESGAVAPQTRDYCARLKALAHEGTVEQIDCGITRGHKAEKKIALVFTAGAHCEGGPTFLDTLNQYGAKASFFVMSTATRTQDPASRCGAVIPRLVSDGHYVGPHSDTHPDLVDRQGGTTTISRQRLDRELVKNVEALRETGVRGELRYWMPPSETFNEQVATWSAENGMATVHLTECPQTRGDYLPSATRGGTFSNEAILARVFDCAAKDPNHLNGAILFFHLGIGTSRDDPDKFHHAFPALMKKLVADGYSFVRIDEMLDGSVGRLLGAQR